MPKKKKSRAQRRKDFRLDQALTLTVAASPTSARKDGSLSLKKELQLVRSSVLYADKVDLIAPTASLLQSFVPLKNLNSHQAWYTLRKLPPETLERLGVIEQGVSISEFRNKIAFLGSLPINDPQRREGELLWRPVVEEVLHTAKSTLEGAEAPELQMAIENGAVRLIDPGTRFEDAIDVQVDAFRRQLETALANPAGTVLFDELATRIVREDSALREKLTGIKQGRTRRAATGTGLVEYLPVFPNASMKSVLEAHDELSDGRADYRRAVKRLADELKSSALDDTLPSEINELWMDEVRPTLVDLRKSVSVTRIAQETGYKLSKDGIDGPKVTIGVAGLGWLADLISAPETLVSAGAGVAWTAAWQVVEARKEKRKHDLVYLLDVNRKLKKR